MQGETRALRPQRGARQLRLSQVIYTLFVALKLATNLIRIPYFALVNPVTFARRVRRWVDEIINLEINIVPPIEAIDLEGLARLLGGKEPRLNVRFDSKHGNINFLESVALSYIVYACEPRSVFEIGTFDGFSTYHLAKNSGEDARIYTLNLSVEDERTRDLPRYSLMEYQGDSQTHAELRGRGLGAMYKATDVAHKVTQLVGDSLTYDYAPFFGQVDLVFIDGGHSYRHVSSDSENAFRMLSDRGVIVWHDFNTQHRDISRFLRRVAREKKLYHVVDTRLVVYFRAAVSGTGVTEAREKAGGGR